jgi:hypothetical protein
LRQALRVSGACLISAMIKMPQIRLRLPLFIADGNVPIVFRAHG